jgi:elongation factor G
MSQLIDIDIIRNIGIMAHIDAGKTTTTERMLFYSGFLHRMGEVHEGSAFMDYMEQERERGITITAAATPLKWKDHHINIIDTPGHVDFTAEVQRSLRVLDGAVAVLDAVSGVEPQTETVWRQADEYNVPRLVFINKMDRAGADFYAALQSIVDRFGANAVPVELPIGAESDFRGVIDLRSMKAYEFDTEDFGKIYKEIEMPTEFNDKAIEFRTKLIDSVIEQDEDMMLAYLEGEEPTASDLDILIRKATLAGTMVPVLCGSALKNIGIQPILDAVVSYLPSPSNISEYEGFKPDTEHKEIRKSVYEEPFSGLAFKVQTDPFVGKLVYVRIYSGVLEVGDSVMNTSIGKRERVNKIVRMTSNKREEIQKAGAGDIVALPSLRMTRTGETLSDDKNPIIYEKINFLEPVIKQSVEAKTLFDRKKLLDVLEKFVDEDPTFRFENDEESGQILISGVGELHLEIIKDRLDREFKLPVRVGKPQVAYREKVLGEIEKSAVFEETISGKTQFGEVTVSIGPEDSDSDAAQLVKAEKSVPRSVTDAAVSGAKDSLQIGTNGYPLIDTRLSIRSIGYVPDKTTELGTKIAAGRAVSDAIRSIGTELFEPYFKVEVTLPEEFLGDIISDLNSRNGKIETVDQKSGLQVVTAGVPLSRMFGYVTALRSMSQGRASYSMTFSHYERIENR